MNLKKTSFRKKGLFSAFLLGALLSLLLLALSQFLPSLISSSYYQKSLNSLRNQAQLIKNDFAQILENMGQKQRLIAQLSFPKESSQIFLLFKRMVSNPAVEGIASYNSEGKLMLWLGNVTDIGNLLRKNESSPPSLQQKNSLLIQDKASFFLLSLQKTSAGEHIVLYRLLAFRPQLKSPYLEDYHFLKPRLRKNCEISYWDFREDVSGFEKIFLRHKDEYIGQPRLQREVQSLFFPLRNRQNNIIATVTLRSPSLGTHVLSQKENFLLFFYLLSGVSLVFLLLFLCQLILSSRGKKPLPGLLFILTLTGLRLLFFPLSGLEKIRSLPVFSPTLASFFSLGNFTKSPADIFLTSLFLFLIIGCIAVYVQELVKNINKKPLLVLSFLFNLALIVASIFLLLVFQNILSRLVFNSNVNLLRFSFRLTFFLLHFSLVFFFFAILVIIFMGLKAVACFSSRLLIPSLILLMSLSLLVFAFEEKGSIISLAFQTAVLALIALAAFFPGLSKRKEFIFVFLVFNTLWIYHLLDTQTKERTQALIQNSLRNTISSQVPWGNFFIEQSFPAIEKQNKLLLSFLKNPQPAPDLARLLWEKTILAKFNWYSSLEILNPQGDVLSHFSLNIPRILLPSMNLPLNKNWIASPLNIPFLGEEKELIVGYKDWFEGENHLGRTILYLSVDYDMLPFLYSANPYFELLRVHSIPSLNQFDFGFAIFDFKGNLIFNPHKISAGISPELIQRIQFSSRPIWSAFVDKRKKYHSLYFGLNNRIYILFFPQKNLITQTIELLKLLFFYSVLLLISSFFLWLALAKHRFKHLFWSFSNRVYISFIAVALIPLFLFTFFTRSFFSRIYSQQFIEKAEVHSNFARRVMDDFIFFQQEEKASLEVPPEDLVLWISTTIANDVNLYQDGRLVSSSRREFFDSGLLPDLLDGEIYYQILYEKNPFYTKIRRIGNFSFRTLTIPYSSPGSLLLISLPFPLEQQEISKATGDLLEFLFFVSVFFIATVLILARGIGAMIITPIKKLLAGTKEASLGNLEISIDHKPKDEMKTLVDGFNSMIQNLKNHQQELAEMSKKVAWAEMARKVAHEVKNPLTPIQLSAEHLLRVYEDKKGNFDQALKESISYIVGEVENLRRIAQEFLEISKENIIQKELFDFKELIRETIGPYTKLLVERIQFKEFYHGEDFRFEGDRSKLKTALRNLFTNAIESIRGKGEIRTHLQQTKEGLTVMVEDSGMGIEKEIIERIFEPYFSTKDVGTGLGLPITKKIIEDHQGSIQIASEPKKGTRITIHLPLAKS